LIRFFVMPGLVPCIHALSHFSEGNAWMAAALASKVSGQRG
jgi:hypothetical protein